MRYLVLIALAACTGPLSAPELAAARDRAYCRLVGDTAGVVVVAVKGVIVDCGYMIEREKVCFEVPQTRRPVSPCVVGDTVKR